MTQIDPTQFLAALNPKDKAAFYQDIAELKTRIWERVALPPVPDSSKSSNMKPNLENSHEVLNELLLASGFRFEVLCFHVWIPDYFNEQLEHCKVCEKIRKKKTTRVGERHLFFYI